MFGIEDSFCEDAMSAMPEDHHCSKYADYLSENYVTDHSKFPSEMRAEIPSNNKSTKNGTKSFNAQFYTAHPSIFVLLEVLVIVLYGGLWSLPEKLSFI